MDFNNPRYFEDEIDIAKPIKKIKNMNKSIAYLESVSRFENDGEDATEVVTITEAHRAVYMGMVEVLEELKAAQAIEYSTVEIEKLIAKYKKKQ